jgi:hypothetical protein
MRRWVSALAVFAGLAFAAPALADSPSNVYSDFAQDGVLSCGHSRSALKGALNDASLHQYGDPLTFIEMKLAIRKQLAGSCRRAIAAHGSTGGTGAAPNESSQGASASTTGPTGTKTKRQRGSGSDQSTQQAATPNVKNGAADSKQSGGMILLAIGLLLLTLGSGGWAARRAFGDRE